MHLLTAMLKPIVGVTADTPNAAVMAEILIPCDYGDWEVGEVGIVLFNDNPTFDVCLLLGGMRDVKIGDTQHKALRVFYFKNSEVRIL